MNRETKEITTPSGVKVIIKTWISAREANAVKEEMLKAMKVDPATGNQTTSLSAEFLIQQEKKLIETLVVSVDGDTNAYIEKLLDMRNEDYQAVVSELNKIHLGNFIPAK